MKASLLPVLVLLVAASLFPAFKPWYNYYNSYYGTKAISLGNAFTAVADDGTAAFWNPAGFSRFPEPRFYLSYRTDTQKLYEHESRTTAAVTENYTYLFNSRLNQIDFFSIAFPLRGRGWHWGGALSYYRYIPTGFKGYSETTYYTDPLHAQSYHRLDFVGSEGIDVLAFSAAASYKDIASFGVTLQNFFNTSNIQYNQTAAGVELSQSESKLLGGRNWIFGMLVSPVRILTIGVTCQLSLRSKIRTTSLSGEDGAEEGGDGATENIIAVHLPSRIAFGVRIEPFSAVSLNYEYSKVYWEQGTLQGFESFNKNLFFSFKGEESLQKRNPENHRFGGEFRFVYRGVAASLRAGWFRDRQFYTDARAADVVVSGFSLGMAVRMSNDLTFELGFQRPTAKWREASFFYEDLDLWTTFTGSIVSLSMTYKFKSLFRTS